ncbi:MAG: J domain-containing protein [Bacteroidetes bacterium]|nr:J domain-containing protein [Bacteroidota bacterium]
MTLFNDYYKTLGLPFNASNEDIKKRYRKMALQFHPDTNEGDDFAHNRFREIQEAYEVLSNPQRRYNYDREWRLHFPTQSATATRNDTPESILSDLLVLEKKVLDMDEFRFNKDKVFTQLKQFFSENNIALLRHEATAGIKKEIINAVMKTGSRLNANHILFLSGKLTSLLNPGETLYTSILTWEKKAKQQAFWEKYKLLFALLIALALCFLIKLIT